jgi:hypothetical protein
MQWDDNADSAGLSPAMLYAAANGFRMEVGNVNQAMDSVALMYASEIGFNNRSVRQPDRQLLCLLDRPVQRQPTASMKMTAWACLAATRSTA